MPITTKTRIVLVMHKGELQKSTSTARLLSLILPESVCFVIGAVGVPAPTQECFQIMESPALLFPTNGAPVLSTEDAENVKTLIVPDGTWTQAKRIVHRRSELWNVPKRQLPVGSPSEYTLRRNQSPEGVCTAEAVARALGILEGAKVQEGIESQLRRMVSRVEWSRRTSQLYNPAM